MSASWLLARWAKQIYKHFSNGMVISDGTMHINSLDSYDQLDEITDFTDSEAVELLHSDKNRKCRIPRMAGVMARKARIQFCDPKYTEANVLVISKFIRDKAKEMNMRNCDLAMIMPYAVKLSFVKTTHEILADQLEVSPQYTQRVLDGSTDWWSSSSFLQAFMGDVRRMRRPASE